MFFEFNILGLLIVFMLMILYHYKGGREKYPFNLILWFSYVLQLLYVITGVGIEKNNYVVFGKLYFVCLVLLMGLFSVYNLVSIVKDRYKLNSIKGNTWIKRINILSIIIAFLLSGLVVSSKFWLSDSSLVFGNNIINIIMWGFVVFNYIIIDNDNKITSEQFILFLILKFYSHFIFNKYF